VPSCRSFGGAGSGDAVRLDGPSAISTSLVSDKNTEDLQCDKDSTIGRGRSSLSSSLSAVAIAVSSDQVKGTSSSWSTWVNVKEHESFSDANTTASLDREVTRMSLDDGCSGGRAAIRRAGRREKEAKSKKGRLGLLFQLSPLRSARYFSSVADFLLGPTISTNFTTGNRRMSHISVTIDAPPQDDDSPKPRIAASIAG
jgi:hypothetical protein